MCAVQAAAKAYAAAHFLEVAELTEEDGPPNPYARLNQIALEVLASGDNNRQRDRLLGLIKCVPGCPWPDFANTCGYVLL